MAFNLQMPNSTYFQHKNYLIKEKYKNLEHGSRHLFGADSMYSYLQKIGNISPSLCFQADVFYPNARAAVNSVTCKEGRFVMGCKGNQIQRDFSLEPRVPVAVPLVQYPSFSFGPSLDEIDICAKPVLNWEEYISNVKKKVFKGRFRQTMPGSKTKSLPPLYNPYSEKQRARLKARRREQKYQHLIEEDRPTIEEDSGTTDPSSSDSDSDYDETEFLSSAQKRNLSKSKGKIIHYRKLFKKRGKTIKTLRDKLFANKDKTDPEKNSTRRISLKWLKKKYNAKETDKELLLLSALKRFKKVPELRVEATWNYIYGGSNGACCIVQNDMDIDKSLNVYTGCRTKLRKVQLEESEDSMLSYKVTSIWEEDASDVPSNIRAGRNNPLCDLIYQIVPHKYNILGVRRGKSIELYSIEDESPYLLDSISNICYGTDDYDGWKMRSTYLDVVTDPLLLGLDFNPQYSPEFITIDENNQIRIVDFCKGETISSYHLSKISRTCSDLKQYPKYRNLNDASGISFCKNGQIFLAWGDSKVVLGDRRDDSVARSSLIDIFDLRRSFSSLSWSDQNYFNESIPKLNEHISSVKMSKKEYYYYTGTTSKIFLMDIRVPGQPVLKMQHGMSSPAAYLETFTARGFETIVSASQREPSTFCAITDHAHVNCVKRPNCEAKNPILHCLPRQLSSSREFFNTILEKGYTCVSEADHRRTKDHNYAWTTGLTVFKTLAPIKSTHVSPPGMMILTSNCYGDVFYQEWEKRPIKTHKKTSTKDSNFVTFMQSWRDSMSSTSLVEYNNPSLNLLKPVDCSLIVETCARNVQNMTRVRNKPFSPFKPDKLIHSQAQKHKIDIADRLELLKIYNSPIAQHFCQVWEDEIVPCSVKQEIVEEGDGNIWNEEDESYDVQFIEQPQSSGQESHEEIH